MGDSLTLGWFGRVKSCIFDSPRFDVHGGIAHIPDKTVMLFWISDLHAKDRVSADRISITLALKSTLDILGYAVSLLDKLP